MLPTLRLLVAVAFVVASAVVVAGNVPTNDNRHPHRPSSLPSPKTTHRKRSIIGSIAFLPRGGTSSSIVDETANESNASDDDESNDDETSSHQGESRQAHKREVVKGVRADQLFLEKQRQRRALDKTWLDKGITAVIEGVENVFRWEVTN